MRVIFAPIAQEKLQELTDHLLKNWNYRVKMDFLEKLETKIEQVKRFPESCPRTKTVDGLYKYVITVQTTLYYRILSDRGIIEIALLFDTRQDPNKLREY